MYYLVIDYSPTLLVSTHVPSCCLEGLLVQWWSTQTPPGALRSSRPFFHRRTHKNRKNGLRRDFSCIGCYDASTHSPHCRHPRPTLGPAAASSGPGGRSSGLCPGPSLSGCHKAPEGLAATSRMAGGKKVKGHDMLTIAPVFQPGVCSGDFILVQWFSTVGSLKTNVGYFFPLSLSAATQIYCLKNPNRPFATSRERLNSFHYEIELCGLQNKPPLIPSVNCLSTW